MKNLTLLTSKQEIRDYIRNLWQTDIFRESQDDPDGYIHDLVEKVAKRPVIFFEMTDSSVEWTHFTTWMGAYALRKGKYDNPYIHDLYFVHEFWHGATMEYDSDLSFPDWHNKMSRNEMFASVHSECFIYFAMKGLREKTFDFEIWVDRFLENANRKRHPDPYDRNQHQPSFFSRGMTDKEIFEELYTRRKRVMMNPDPFDFIELQTHYYAMQNLQWSNIWKENYWEVENHMERVDELVDVDMREEAGKILEYNIIDLRKEYGGLTPFTDEAKAFAKIVKENKKRQGNELLK